MRRQSLPFLLATVLVGLLVGLLGASVPGEPVRAQPTCGLIQEVRGTLTGDTIWTPDRLYVLTGDVTVNTGATLFIEPGTVIKAKQDTRLLVYGTLTANGAAGNPISFTSWHDDAICGDTNENGGVSAPKPGDWGYINFNGGSSDTSSVTRAVLRYGGKSGSNQGGPIMLVDASPVLEHLSLEQNQRNAAQLWPGYWNTVTLSSTTVVYLLSGDVSVNSDRTLTIAPGVKLKAGANARLLINGKLTADGTPAAPIYFTSEKDDSVCGVGASDEPVCDANNAVDGPAALDWGYLYFYADSNDSSSVTRTVLRYGGKYSSYRTGPVALNNANPTLANLSMERNYRNAVQLWSGAWSTTTLDSTTVVYWLGDDIVVNSGHTFTIDPGVKLKAGADARLLVEGKLTADGTPAAPIYFTSEKDDSVCGVGASDELVCDTNSAVDGPAPLDWGYLYFHPSSNDSSSVTRAVFRYAGKYGSYRGGPIIFLDASPNLANLSMERNYRNAAYLWPGGWNTTTLNSATVVYWLGGDVTVNGGQTLTIAPGAKLKAGADARLLVYGKLLADGTAAFPIYFTSEKDDTVCGVGASNEPVCDTDNAVDGPAPKDWGYIYFHPSSNDSSSISRATLRYGGKDGSYLRGVLNLQNAAPSIAYVRFQQNYVGVDLFDGALPSLTCNDFEQSEVYGVRNNQPATVASALGQWWGSVLGPVNGANPDGDGEKVTNGVDFRNWATAPCTYDPATPAPPPWLALLYLAGDNAGPGTESLSGPMRELLARLAAMPPNPAMRLVVLFDGDQSGDTKIYTRGSDGLVDVTETAAQDWLGGLPGTPGSRELDTGSAASLSTFINWATAAYPGSSHTMLAIVDHGGGWAPDLDVPAQPRGGVRVQAGSWRGMNIDLTTPGGSSLATRGLGQALRNSAHIDVLFLDACLMAMLENAYEVRDYADYLVAGENVLFAYLPYDTYLARGRLLSTTTPRELATQIVDGYNEGLNLAEQPFALSALDLSRLRDDVNLRVSELLNRLAARMIQSLPETPTADDPLIAAILQAYGEAQKFDYDSSLELDQREGYVDLVDFAARLRDSPGAVPSDIRGAAGDLASAATGGATPLILRNRAVSGSFAGRVWDFAGANGLAVFLPLGERDYRPTSVDPDDPSKASAEPQLKYYADPTQLMLTHDAPSWAELLVLLEPVVPVMRTGPGGLPAALAAAAVGVDTKAFSTPGQVGVGAGRRSVYLPLVRR